MNFKWWFEAQLNEDFKTQRQNFINQGISPEIVDRYLVLFKDIKDKKYKEIFAQLPNVTIPTNQRVNIDAYKNFHELEVLVDYVRGQRDLGKVKFTDVQFSGKPIYNGNGLEIYYAETPRACIQYKGNVPYSWCIARGDAGNMFYTYRFKEHEPAFYFVKDLEKTKAEFGMWNATKTVFSGKWRDKYHFFVVQVLKNANDDSNRKQYIVTSAQNDGDVQMSWNELLAIEPKLQGLQKVLISKPLTDEERQDYKRFKNGVDDATFAKLDYNEKNRYLDIAVRIDKPLSDKQFQLLPEELKNKYIGFGVGLSDGQYNLINQGMAKRYKDITLRKIEEIIKDHHNILLKPSEITIFMDNNLEGYMKLVEEARTTDTRFLSNLISGISAARLDKLSPEHQKFILDTIKGWEVPITDPMLLDKVIKAPESLGRDEEYLTSEMIERIIRQAEGDEAKFRIAKHITDIKKDNLSMKDINSLFQVDENISKNYLDNIAGYVVQTVSLEEYGYAHILEISNSSKAAHFLIAKYGKELPHELLISILNHVPNREAVKLALQMKDKLTEDELKSILKYTNVENEELYGILGHHAQEIVYPDGHNWVIGSDEDRQGSEPHYLLGSDGKIKVKLSVGHNGIWIWPGGNSVEDMLKKAIDTNGNLSFNDIKKNVLKEYQPPSKWNDYIVDFIIKKPDIKALNLRGGAWSIGDLNEQQREKLFKGRPDLLPEINLRTTDGHIWVKGTSIGGIDKKDRDYTLLYNYYPVLIFTLNDHYLQQGMWTSQKPTEAYETTDKGRYSLATAEFILHNKIEHMDVREKNIGWEFNDLLPEHQKMVLARYPDFLEPFSLVKKLSKNREEMLHHMSSRIHGMKLLDENTVIVKDYDTIEDKKLLSTYGYLNIPGYGQWVNKVVKILDRKIHGEWGENHRHNFEDLAKKGLPELQAKFPFADEEMMNLAREHGYRTSGALSHSIGRVVMPKVMNILYNKLKSFNTNKFKVLLRDDKIYFVMGFDDVIGEYSRNKTLKGLEGEYKSWIESMKVNWGEFIEDISKIDRGIDKEAFRNAISSYEQNSRAYDYETNS